MLHWNDKIRLSSADTLVLRAFVFSCALVTCASNSILSQSQHRRISDIPHKGLFTARSPSRQKRRDNVYTNLHGDSQRRVVVFSFWWFFMNNASRFHAFRWKELTQKANMSRNFFASFFTRLHLLFFCSQPVSFSCPLTSQSVPTRITSGWLEICPAPTQLHLSANLQTRSAQGARTVRWQSIPCLPHKPLPLSENKAFSASRPRWRLAGLGQHPLVGAEGREP